MSFSIFFIITRPGPAASLTDFFYLNCLPFYFRCTLLGFNGLQNIELSCDLLQITIGMTELSNFQYIYIYIYIYIARRYWYLFKLHVYIRISPYH